MYIIQMADLHIGSQIETNPEENRLIQQSAELIKERIPSQEKILLCLCGDIIDSKGLEKTSEEVKTRYNTAADLIENFIHQLEDLYEISIMCCMGNHDCTHMDEFYDFTKRIRVDNVNISKKQLETSYVYTVEKTAFVFVNSCKDEDYEIGRIDYDALEGQLKKVRENRKILVLHHTVMSMFEDDGSSIRNAAKLISLIDKYNISYVLHGHIHGREILTIGQKQCRVIGVGALFSRDNANVNSQFNIIKYCSGLVTEILNCRYNTDGGDEPWNANPMPGINYNTYFRGENFKEVYNRLIDRLNVEMPLYNVVLEINSDYQKFVRELKEFLENDCLEIGMKSHTYFELAKLWEADTLPDELYFNHGTYFKVNGVSGIEFVKEKLNKKSTSNRILLSTYNMEKVVSSFDDDSIYLPSLGSVQFGKDDEENKLLVHMDLRALEAGRFLKINICEIAYMLERLRKGRESVSFDKVDITISAFRVQKKERFNCFLKAEIDKMSAEELTAKVCTRKISELCKMLEEKRDGMETITIDSGLRHVCNAMEQYNKENDNIDTHYGDKILKQLKDVLDVYETLRDIHQKTSIPNEEEKRCEEQIDMLLGELIQELKNSESDGKEEV